MDTLTGTCSKHGKFVLTEGCDKCLGKDRSTEELEEGLAQEGLELVKPQVIETATLELMKPQDDSAIAKIYADAISLRDHAKILVVNTLEDAKRATNDGKIINSYKKELEEYRKQYIAPFQDHIAEVNEAFKMLAEPLMEAKQITDGKLMDFTAAQRKKQADEEEINRLRYEAAQKEAALNNGEISESVNMVEVHEAPKHIRTNFGMAGETKRWTHEVINFAELPDIYKLPNTALINKAIISSKGKIEIPGVRAFQTSKITYR